MNKKDWSSCYRKKEMWSWKMKKKKKRKKRKKEKGKRKFYKSILGDGGIL